MNRSIFSNNLALYSRGRIARHYARRGNLFPAEQKIIDRVTPWCVGRPILDVGVGGGRTTPHMVKLSQNYTGIDYSLKMVELCRRRFQGVRFEHADARRLDNYPEDYFAFVLFSFNGLDYVSHQDRITILGELRRILSDGGMLAFSTHNRWWEGGSRFDPRTILTGNPLKFISRAINYPIKVWNYSRIHHLEREEKEYSLRVGRAFNYSLLTYHIYPSIQKRQLEEMGFELLSIFDMEGNEISVNYKNSGPWLHYLARKA